MKNSKINEQYTQPDDYANIAGGNANTAADATYGDFNYTVIKVGNVTKNVRYPIISDQTNPAPFPENVADPFSDPDRKKGPFPENVHDPEQNPDIDPTNGVMIQNEENLRALDPIIADATERYYQQPGLEKEREERDREDSREER